MKLAALTLVLLAIGLALPAQAAAQATLLASVNGNFEISLRQNGEDVTHLAAGTYTILVTDSTSGHNFHLRGPGVDEATSVGGVESRTWTVTFTDGVYTFNCDRHPSMNGSFTVGAVLTVSRSGDGFGTVTSSPPGLTCSWVCTVAFPEGELVTLTATPRADSAFGGWSGACSGSECVVTVSGPVAIQAQFALLPLPPAPPPPPEATAPATVTKITIRHRDGRSIVRIRLAVTRHASVQAVLRRRGKTIASNVAHLAPGTRIVAIRAPRGASGAYRLRISLTDAATHATFLTVRAVKL